MAFDQQQTFLLCFPLLLALLCGAAAAAEVVTISNVKPRMDVDGAFVRAHDGTYRRDAADGAYWLYGASYGDCAEQPSGCANTTLGNCGFRLTHTVLAYTSMDLVSWKLVSDILPYESRPVGVYYRPKVVLCPATGLYTLWVNWLPGGDFGRSQYLVATSKTPAGPFAVVADNVKTRYATGGDFDILVDDDGSGYLIYTSLAQNHGISVERLSDDFQRSAAALNASMSSGIFGTAYSEAPSIFRRGGVYYALFGRCCCFCGEGSDVEVYTATASPLGPWSFQGEVGRLPSGASTTKAQQNFVFHVDVAGGHQQWLWTGDHWQSAPDKVKDHDLQTWLPMAFDDTKAVPVVQNFAWVDSFTLNLVS